MKRAAQQSFALHSEPLSPQTTRMFCPKDTLKKRDGEGKLIQPTNEFNLPKMTSQGDVVDKMLEFVRSKKTWVESLLPLVEGVSNCKQMEKEGPEYTVVLFICMPSQAMARLLGLC